MVDISKGRGPAMVATALAPLVLTWAFSLLRVYVRCFILKIWKVEDWFFIASQCTFTVLACCGLISALHGNGQHTLTIPMHDIELALEWWFVGQVFYTVTAILIRLSIGCFLLRICLGKLQRWVISIAMTFISIITILYFTFIMIQCHPLSYFWTDYSGAQGNCYSLVATENITIIYSVSAAATDLTLGILPLFVIYTLRINTKAKCIVACLLCLGIIAGLSVIVRIEFIHLVNLSHDFLWNTSMVAIWSIIEPAIGIICMAASTYRPLFKSLRNKSTYNGSDMTPPYWNSGLDTEVGGTIPSNVATSTGGKHSRMGSGGSASYAVRDGYVRTNDFADGGSGSLGKGSGSGSNEVSGLDMDVLGMGVRRGVSSPRRVASPTGRREVWEDEGLGTEMRIDDRFPRSVYAGMVTTVEARNLRMGKVGGMI